MPPARVKYATGVRHYLGIEMQWDLSLILAADEVQGVTLGGTARLGYTSWLGARAAAARS
ncbi:Uncharacterized protein conserved in bacteria [Pantoea agglomerans]|uniref:Uncharacterized protein conserved in bacteria n=1 Tax=Enterobacter agglomerans TaxID=549 RepID=A0A379AHC5_ENTAG|nr:Uncharacterized protein conserved in bacteria [Pantoea agglomerans]